MHRTFITIVLVLFLAFVLVSSQIQPVSSTEPTVRLCLAAQDHKTQEQIPQPQVATEYKHSYHDHPPTGPLPATLDPKQFHDNNHYAFVCYSLAAQFKDVLYQLPCYCPCDKTEGHESLLDCFVGRHGVGCDACQREIILAYEEFKHGKTPAEIRGALANDGWRKLSMKDLKNYTDSYYSRESQDRR
jgi:hypothetical protein